MNRKTELYLKNLIKSIILILFILLNQGCSNDITSFTNADQDPVIEPDYTSVTIPPNIAPLNFRIKQPGDRFFARFYNQKGIDFTITSKSGIIEIPRKKWRRLLSSASPGSYSVDICIKISGRWEKYNTVTNSIASDSVDKYLVYRLIEPGFETWNKMGIYQRNLEDFMEIPVMLNSYSDGNCMNCHSFCRNNGDDMMFHMRGTNAGTIIYQNGELSKVNTKTKNAISPGVYPSWHPEGNYIAFSVNNIVQSFHSLPDKKVEVYDTLSDVVVYDIKKNIVTGCNALSVPGSLETFPSWSPDGRYLYFCSAVKRPPDQFSKVHYDLLRIPFDPLNCSFGIPDTVWKVSEAGKSISFPRISPDGRYLMVCISDYGNFTIWHSESDLYILDLTNGKVHMPDINSSRSESFHNWSSSGRWIVFSSRRGDGLFTRPFFSYFDKDGEAHKPFLLPQKDPAFYNDFLKSYNVPELVKEKTALNPRLLYKIVTTEPKNATFSIAQ